MAHCTGICPSFGSAGSRTMTTDAVVPPWAGKRFSDSEAAASPALTVAVLLRNFRRDSRHGPSDCRLAIPKINPRRAQNTRLDSAPKGGEGNHGHLSWPQKNTEDQDFGCLSASFVIFRNSSSARVSGVSASWQRAYPRFRTASTSRAGVRSPVQLIRRGASRKRSLNPSF